MTPHDPLMELLKAPLPAVADDGFSMRLVDRIAKAEIRGARLEMWSALVVALCLLLPLYRPLLDLFEAARDALAASREATVAALPALSTAEQAVNAGSLYLLGLALAAALYILTQVEEF